MSIKKLDIFNVRNIQEASLHFSPSFNFIYGKNASGKSALIEAIFLLGRAKSFRSTNIKSVIAHSKDNLIVSAHVLQAYSGSTQIGLQMDGKEISIRINQQSCRKRSILVQCLPIQIIHPKSYELLDAGAQIRREFLDWGIFNHNNDYLPLCRNYKKILAQRNALLKTRNLNQINVWNKELAYYGTMVNNYRSLYIDKLEPIFIRILADFLHLNNLSLKLISGWELGKSLEQLLSEDIDKDQRYGFTHSGPHRGDFCLLIENKLAKETVSRGQLKLLVTCLKLAQVQLMFKEKEFFGCFLIDDFAAELDKNNREKVINYLSKINCQVFLTSTDIEDFGDFSSIENYKLFHVEHGKIRVENVPRGTLA